MSRRNKSHNPPHEPRFSSTPFASLKGVLVSEPLQPPSVKADKHTAAYVPDNDSEAAELFQRAMAGIRPLDATSRGGGKPSTGAAKRPSNRQTAVRESDAPNKSEDDVFRREIGRLKLEVTFEEQRHDEDELKALNGNRLRQLKRGIIVVDHQLDLHGLTRDEALGELPRFLRSARLRGQKAVLIITGKGLNSPAEPVLQQAVAGWLRDAGRELVAEYAPAPREMGGSGAFVVFLRPVPSPVPRKE